MQVFALNENVYFDNLAVQQEHGRISEETHYFAFGLKNAAISSRAFGKLQNKYGYQGDYVENDEETGYDGFELRNYDAQLGRWLQPDPYDEFASGYVGMGNDPVNNVDPSGGINIPAIADLGSNFLNAVGNVAISTAVGYGKRPAGKLKDGTILYEIALDGTGLLFPNINEYNKSISGINYWNVQIFWSRDGTPTPYISFTIILYKG